MRDMMAQIRDVGDGIRGGTYTMTAPIITGGTITGVALSGNTLTNPVITGAAISTSTLTGNTFTNPVISGGSINNTPIGASTANTGKFTTLEATGATTFSGATVANTFSSSGATITGGSINGAAIGATTPSTVKTTALTVTGATSGTLAIEATAVAGTNTATFPAATGTVMVSGNMPAFSAFKNSGAQTISSATATKITFDTELFDTNSNYASSRFTPTVAGYYQISSVISMTGSGVLTRMILALWKNGSEYTTFQDLTVTSFRIGGSQLVYLNGTTDFVEIYVALIGTSPQIDTGSTGTTGYNTVFSGAMVRGA
jgi:hypothetical protein